MANVIQNIEEEWRAVKDYPGYEVSNMGRIRSEYLGSKKICTKW